MSLYQRLSSLGQNLQRGRGRYYPTRNPPVWVDAITKNGNNHHAFHLGLRFAIPAIQILDRMRTTKAHGPKYSEIRIVREQRQYAERTEETFHT